MSARKEFSGSDATGDDDVLLFTISDAEAYNRFVFQCSAGAIDVEVTLDKTNWTAAQPLKDSAGAALTGDAVDAGEVGILEGEFNGVRVRKKGVTNPTAAAAIASRV